MIHQEAVTKFHDQRVNLVATATTPSTTYYACLRTVGGTLYNVNSTGSPKCTGKDLAISWSQKGPAGANGTNGKTILNGTATPTSTIGNNGDFYLDTATHTLYGPKANGTWPTAGTSLVGPQGLKGANGATGATGAKGATGATGATGAQGPAGTNGNTVLNGASTPASGVGNNGDFYLDTATDTLYGPKASGTWPTTGTSLVGPQGTAGATGATGAQGAAGTKGTNGTSVSTGTSAPFNIGTCPTGNTYIDITNGEVYSCSSGKWVNTGKSIMGPAGANGVTYDCSAAAYPGIDLAECSLTSAALSGANLDGADLSVANLESANLTEAALEGANLASAWAPDATLTDAKLDGANLTAAVLGGASLADASLVGTDLTGADLSDASLDGANMLGADLNDVEWDNTTCPDDTNSNSDGGTCIGHLTI
ncbi:MAG: pentapeptide repeat-containing protein [Acidimicrobiales bacterium]